MKQLPTRSTHFPCTTLFRSMQDAGLDVRVDAAGNILGRRAGRDATRPPILFGSHIDSVPEGGNYDGALGSLGAIRSEEHTSELQSRPYLACPLLLYKQTTIS